jgi:phosphoribosylamine--glycine ligase
MFDPGMQARVMDEIVLPVLSGMRAEGSEFRAASGELEATRLNAKPEPHVGVVLASGGYPDTYETGKVIHGLADAEALPDVNVFHSGTAKRGPDVVTAGGRVLTVVGSGDDYRKAIRRAYDAVDLISFDRMHFRRDIAAKALT